MVDKQPNQTNPNHIKELWKKDKDKELVICLYWDSDATLSILYLPTPPLRQDMTQGQFLSEV